MPIITTRKPNSNRQTSNNTTLQNIKPMDPRRTKWPLDFGGGIRDLDLLFGFCLL